MLEIKTLYVDGKLLVSDKKPISIVIPGSQKKGERINGKLSG